MGRTVNNAVCRERRWTVLDATHVNWAMIVLVLGLGAPRSVGAQGGAIRHDTISTIIVGREQSVQATIIYSGGTPPIDSSGVPDTITVGPPSRFGRGDLTTMYVSPCLKIGTVVLREGLYSLWIERSVADAALIISRHGKDTEAGYDSASDVGRIQLAMDVLSGPPRNLAIRFRAVRVGPDEIGVRINRSGTKETVLKNSGLITSLEIDSGHSRWSTPVSAPDTLPHKTGPFHGC